VPLAAYQAFLLGWQGVGSDRTGSAANLEQSLHQLRGLALPLAAWEREVLPARAGDAWRDVDALLAEGDYAWVAAGAEGRPSVRFLARREGGLFLSDLLTGLGDGPEGDVFAYLKSEGPSFFADIQGGTRLSTAGLRNALRQLALAGVVTGEDWAALSVVSAEQRGGDEAAREMSALQRDLAERLPPRPGGRARGGARLTAQHLRQQRRNIIQRVDAEAQAEAGWSGRWALVNRAAIMGPPRSIAERASQFIGVALARYGVITPEISGRNETRWTWADEEPAEPAIRALWESQRKHDELRGPRELAWTWGELSEQLRRMELRGEVRRGYFIAGLSGVQYALPAAVEALRAARDGLTASDEVTLLSALDPVNLYGGELGGLATERPEETEGEREADAEMAADAGAFRFARVASTHVVLRRGRPVLVAEDNGTRLTAADVSDEALRDALKAYLNRATAPRRSVINTWNGGPVTGSRGEALLREMGASRSPTGLDYWRGR
jgi:ATP-dependent Lhr-like helicase